MATTYLRKKYQPTGGQKPSAEAAKETAWNLQEQRRWSRILSNAVAYIVLILVSLFFVMPLFYTISTSLKYETDVFDGKIVPDPVIQPVLYNFFGKAGTEKDLTYDGAFFAGMGSTGQFPPFSVYYFNSIFVSSMITFLQLLTCSLAAYAFSRLTWPGRDKIFLAYLGTLMVPGQVTMIPIYILFKLVDEYLHIKILDTYVALILPGAFSAYGTFMLRQYFLSIPKELEEAAIIDGATKLQILRQIIMPLSKTALSTMAIFTFLYAWNDFMWPLIVVNSESMKTLPIGLQAFQSSYGAQWHLIMAASLIVLVPVILIFIFGQKYITRGIMMTGMK
jgi:multiple sugar transport system permease protein